jgi:oxygen-independent coproporphyrinogen-3 oxidase
LPAEGDEGFALYVHWPFCISKCPYCDFNSHVAGVVDHGQWCEALLRELAHFAAHARGRKLTSIFFGGGTPSLMEPATISAVIAAARAHWLCDDALEITLEANPGTVDAARFEAIRGAGIDRLSMGVQALNDADLAFLGRRHSVTEARTAWRAAARIFPRVSFDLIYARPGQSLDAWRDELTAALDEVLSQRITHLSLYQLTMETGTPMAAAHARGEVVLPDEETAARLYELTQELCTAAGLPAYEISNHAVPGQACRHNLTYWRGGDYVGIGPGAHGRIMLDGDAHATRQLSAPNLWLRKVMADGHATQEDTHLSPRLRAEERVMVGLRLIEGIDKARFARLTGLPIDQILDPSALGRLVRSGFLADNPACLAATPKGRLVLNALVAQLLVS